MNQITTYVSPSTAFSGTGFLKCASVEDSEAVPFSAKLQPES